MVWILVVAAQFVCAEELGPRLGVLNEHCERLQTITVDDEFQREKNRRLKRLRRALDVGARDVEAFNALYSQMDEVRSWLLAHSAQKPARPEGRFDDQPDAWVVWTPDLELWVAKDTLAVSIQAAGETWRMPPCDGTDVETVEGAFSLAGARLKAAEPFHTGYSTGMTLRLAEFPEAPQAELRLCLNVTGLEVVFELAAPAEIPGLTCINWPKPIETGNAPGDCAVIPHMQGMLLPGNWPHPVHCKDLCNSRTLYMPWWGQIHDGHGVQTILETSDDAGVEYVHPAGGPTRIQPRGYASLGALSYLRSVRYVFDEAATYVTMAKRYRRHARETGRFVSLDEKCARTPRLNGVVGSPVVHLGALYHFVREAQLFNKEQIERNHALTTFDALANSLRELKAKGVDGAYVHLDGWGFCGYDNGHPDVLPAGEEQGGWEGLRRFGQACEELGYFFAVHDQYRDFYLNAVSYDERLALARADGSHEHSSVWCGGPQTILSAWFAPEYVRRNHDLFARHEIPVKGAYLDVFSVVPPEESFDQTHPMTRAECARRRRECFDLLRARGYVVSSEEPTDYLAASLDLVHHGPYPTAPSQGGGAAVGIPVPLFNLVYHDALLIPWDMGENGGWGIPDGDAGRLHCLLNAGMPYASPGADAAQIDRIKEAAALNRRCANQEMVNHEFLDGNRRRQRATYRDGTVVTVDFDSKESWIAYP